MTDPENPGYWPPEKLLFAQPDRLGVLFNLIDLEGNAAGQNIIETITFSHFAKQPIDTVLIMGQPGAGKSVVVLQIKEALENYFNYQVNLVNFDRLSQAFMLVFGKTDSWRNDYEWRLLSMQLSVEIENQREISQEKAGNLGKIPLVIAEFPAYGIKNRGSETLFWQMQSRLADNDDYSLMSIFITPDPRIISLSERVRHMVDQFENTGLKRELFRRFRINLGSGYHNTPEDDKVIRKIFSYMANINFLSSIEAETRQFAKNWFSQKPREYYYQQILNQPVFENIAGRLPIDQAIEILIKAAHQAEILKNTGKSSQNQIPADRQLVLINLLKKSGEIYYPLQPFKPFDRS